MKQAIAKEFAKPVACNPLPNQNKSILHAADLLVIQRLFCRCRPTSAPEGYGEIIGGGERIYDYHLLLERIHEHNLPSLEDYEWYLDLRKYGSVPHSGLGMGIERVVVWICGLGHVRETIPFPRMLNRL